ncbi:MAG: glycosyltransferase family 4 protein [Proteobacteria bacterium]|nr:glycosyltransferase family 4 protein [Pseudomonadota bacterium]
MKTRVVHIIAKLELGGAQENTLYTVGHLDPGRFEPWLITGDEGILLAEARRIKNLNLVIVPELKREISPGNELIALIKIAGILRRLRRENPAILIHTHGSKAGILGRWAGWLARVPERIHTFHGFGFNDYQNFFVRNLYILIEWLTALVTTRMIFVSRNNLEKARRLGILKGEKGIIIRSGVSLAGFREARVDREAKKKELGFSPESPLVGMVACLKPQKAPLDFARVARRVRDKFPDCGFILVGDGVLRPELEKLADELNLGDCFKILGWRRDMPEIMKTLDVLVLTSLWEGLPRVFPEALAAGVPIVATRVDGAEEIVEEEVNGSLCAPHDIQALARKAIYWLQTENRNKKAESHKLWEYEIELMVKKHEVFYGGLFFSNQTARE